MRAIFGIICAMAGGLAVAEVFTYEQFGAVGDGKTDDRAAIVKTHAAANEAGASVRATDGKTYYLGRGEGTAIVKTDVDWGTATFVIDDVKVVNRNSHAFRVMPSQDPYEVEDIAPFKKGATKVCVCEPGSARPRQPGDSGRGPLIQHVLLPLQDVLLALENANVRRYIRFGVNQNKGATQKEVLLVRKDGTVDPGAPVIWDFDAVTKATAYPVDAKRLTIKGGVFVTIANQGESKYDYHSRGIEVNRSNVLLEGIRHEVTGESDHGAPYGGFIQIRYAANVTVKDCVFTAHKLYWTQGHGGQSPMGSYDLTVNESVNTSIINCRQLTDIDDKRYWGLFASNYSKNILFDHVEFSRFDAHMGVANATILNSRLGHMGINAIGCGTFRVENTEIRGPGIFNLRDDYGSTWEGDFIVKNCKLVPNGPRGGQPYLVRGTYTGLHDFGYVCYMPRRITIDGLVIDDTKAPKDYGGPYIFTDFNPKRTSDACVEKYPYQLTEEVVLRNVTTTSGKPVRVSSNTYMFRNVKVVR